MNFITLGNRQRDTVLVGLLVLKEIQKTGSADNVDLNDILAAADVEGAQLLDQLGIDQLVEAIIPGGVQCHNEELPGLLDGYTNALLSLRDTTNHLNGVAEYLNSMDAGLMNTGEVEVEDDGLKVTVDVPEAEPA